LILYMHRRMRRHIGSSIRYAMTINGSLSSHIFFSTIQRNLQISRRMVTIRYRRSRTALKVHPPVFLVIGRTRRRIWRTRREIRGTRRRITGGLASHVDEVLVLLLESIELLADVAVDLFWQVLTQHRRVHSHLLAQQLALLH